ncbi:MAG: LPS assembly lipoprotein LptE [Candidatus Omnitrophica bacterium]|nr:LPS assembly lipoprotein LptE [Candidatus Omnitrophota bacterium]
MKSKAFVLSLLMIPLVGIGCGYTQKQILPNNIKTIYVDTVKNEIPLSAVYAYQPGLEMDITNAIIRRFHIDGNVRVVSHEEADAILQTKLIGFEQEGLRFDSLESIEEYRLFVVVSFKLVDAKTHGVILEEPNFVGDTEYFVSSVRSLGREEAAARAVQRLAKNVVDRIVEDW